MPSNRVATWDKPGPGSWELDSSHTPPAPTRIIRRTFPISIREGYRKVFAEMGGPLSTLDAAFVHGKFYRRLVPLVGENSDRKPPPAPVLWLATRLHPAFRRAEKLAQHTQDMNVPLQVVEHWERTERWEWIEANTAFGAVELGDLTDAALADHLDRLDVHLLAGLTRHHELHASDLGPIGDLLVRARGWGLDRTEVMMTLRGRSPATTEASRMLGAVSSALTAEGVNAADLASLDDVRKASSVAEKALDEYLRLYGDRLVTSYDIDGLTTAELSDTTLAIVVDGMSDRRDGFAAGVDEALVARHRAAVPAAERAEFDELLDTAQRSYGLRDDNGPLTAEWPLGLMRLGFLEAGRRLVEGGQLLAGDDVFELDTFEISGLLRGAADPDLDEVRRRHDERAWEADLEPPALFGVVADVPPSWVMPKALRRMTDIVVEAVSLLEPSPTEVRQTLEGIGIGDRSYVGRARVAHDVDDVIGTLEAGDVLVAAWTAPTFNAVLALAGAVVVQEGGLLCHAAVLARELDLPAVIGCSGAMVSIEDGDTVEVDPVAGRVRVLDA